MSVTLLDGGMGQELIHRAPGAPTPLWATQVMIEMPDLVGDIHADFFAAGAQVATTNTYAIHHDRLIKADLDDQFQALHAAACQQAVRARDANGGGRVAGSIGPLGASYRPDLHPDHAVAVPLYAEIARRLAESCDILICETVASVAHAEAILEGCATTDLPVWLAVTVDDRDGSRLRSGEPVAAILPVAGSADALLANCSAPEVIPAALDDLSQAGKAFGAYANAFTQITSDFLQKDPTVDALSARRDMGPEIYADHVMTWVDRGATIVGGCCEVGPAHIAEMARRLTERGVLSHV